MKKILFLFIILLKITTAFADEPPSWFPYKKTSKNGEYFAWVNYVDKDTSKLRWERKWSLTVYKKDSTIFWQRDFNPSGYNDGTLSDDGKHFVIIQFWYYDDENVVSVFNKDSQDYFIKGSEFNIPKSSLKATASHKLWRESYEVSGDKIRLETFDRSKWTIDLTKRELIKVNDSNFWLFLLFTVTFIALIFIQFPTAADVISPKHPHV